MAPISEALADMPAVEVDKDGEWRVLHGLSVPTAADVRSGETVRIMSDGALIAIGALEDGGIVKPRKVLAEMSE